MAENRVQIVITVDSGGAVTGIRQVDAELIRLSSSGTSSLAGVNSGFSSLGAGIMSAIGLIQTFVTSMAAVKAAEIGLGFNREVEDARLGIAVLLAAQGQFVDGQDRQLQGQQKINAALAYSSNLTKQLQVDNLSTTATFQQLLKTFQQTLSPGLSEGLSVDQVRQYTLAMVQAASAMQIPLDMMAEETRSLLKGTITPRNTLIASALGITPEDIRKLQGDSGALFAFIMEKLQAFVEFGQVAQTTYSGLLSNSKDSLGTILGMATQPFFESLKASLKGFIDYAMQVDPITREMKLNPELVSAFELLNDTLRMALTLAEGFLRTLKAIGTTYSAIKDVAIEIGRNNAGFIGPEVRDFTDTERLERVKQLMAKIIEDQQTIAGWKAGGAGGSLLGAPQIGLANLDISNSTTALENFRAQMVKAGQDTTELDTFLQGLKNTSTEVATAQNAAAGGIGNVRYEANKAVMNLDAFKKKLEEVARINLTGLGDDLAKSIEGLQAKIAVALQGGDPRQQAIAATYAERIRKQATAWALALKENAAPDVFAAISAQKQQSEEEAYWARYLAGVEAVRKESTKKGGAGPIDVEKIDKDILQFREKMQKLYSELEDLDSEYRSTQLERSGRYYDAEVERLNRQTQKKKEAYAKEVADAEQAYLEMQQKLQGKHGGTAEAWGQLAQLKAKWDQAKKAAEEYGDKVDRNLKLTLDMKKAEDDAKRAEELAQLNLEYGKMTGTLQEQLSLQILLLRAEKDRKLLAADPALRTAIERNYAAMERELEIERSGSFFDGFFLAAEKYRKTLPTLAQQGKAAFEMITKGIDSAADALAEFTMTGKMDFASFASSVIRDILRMQYKALLTQLIMGSAGSAGGGGGILGWIMDFFKGIGGGPTTGAYGVETYAGIGHRGGMAESLPDWRFIASYLFSGAARLHEGLAPDEFPAILQRGERVLSRKESREYGTGNQAPPVVINVENKTGTPVTADKTRATFDGKRYVVNVILDDYSRGGDIWKMIRGQRNG